MKKITSFFICLCLIFTTTLFLGCSKKEASGESNDAGKPASLDAALSEESKQEAAASTLPKGDVNTPAEQYKELTEDTQVMFLYYALSVLPVNYEKILTAYSDDYRSSNDEFKKQDILKALTPKIDQEISDAKKQRYIRVEFDGFSLGKYDFQSKSFSQSKIESDSTFSYGGYGGYSVKFTNGDDFKLIHVEDETKARNIESLRSKNARLTLTVYAFAQESDVNSKTVKSQVLKISLKDKNGVELL